MLCGKQGDLMTNQRSIVRQNVELIPGVSGTWIEWESCGDLFERVLVIEVEFDTDPNSSAFQKSTMEAISEAAAGAAEEEASRTIKGLRIVPKRSA
jgi:hypothetical protein